MNHPDRVVHTCLGCGVSLIAFLATIFTADGSSIDRLLWAIVLLGLGWTLMFGHSILFLALPIGLCFYFFRPPIKLQNGDAVDAHCFSVVRAYSVLPDRIVLIREFSDALNGSSVFLPARVNEKTKQILRQSSAISIEIDPALAATALGEALPDLDEVDPETMERAYIDELHKTVTRIWLEKGPTDSKEDVFHLAGWYALLVDRYWRIAERSWFEHAFV